MDTRINPYRILNLEEGEIHTLRNGGGVITEDIIRSLVVSQRKLNTREILVLQHTKCGMTTFIGDELKDEIERETGQRPTFDMLTFEDVYKNVAISVKQLRANPFLLTKDAIRGFVYDVDTDRVEEVIVPD